MKVAIFGASGGTGKLLVERCLAAGYGVKALLRHPDSFANRDRVEIVQGDAKDPTAVAATLQNADVVLSALGARSLRKEDVLEDAVPLIVAAMKAAGVRRIVALGSSGAKDDGLKKQNPLLAWMAETLVYPTLMKYPIASQRAQWATLSSSGLEWTMVMPSVLLNQPARGVYRVDADALPKNGWWIARADVAGFMMQQIELHDWVGKGVYIAW